MIIRYRLFDKVENVGNNGIIIPGGATKAE